MLNFKFLKYEILSVLFIHHIKGIKSVAYPTNISLKRHFGEHCKK